MQRFYTGLCETMGGVEETFMHYRSGAPIFVSIIIIIIIP